MLFVPKRKCTLKRDVPLTEGISRISEYCVRTFFVMVASGAEIELLLNPIESSEGSVESKCVRNLNASLMERSSYSPLRG